MALPLVGSRRARPSPDAMTLSRAPGRAPAPAHHRRGRLRGGRRRGRRLLQPDAPRSSSTPTATVNPATNCSFYVTGAARPALACASRWPPSAAWSSPRRSSCGSCGGSSPRASAPARSATPSPSSSPRCAVPAGCATAYFIFPHALRFLKAVGGPSLHQLLSPNSYLSLILWMMVLFGLTFEFPVVLVALELARVVTPAQLLHWWRWAVIGITAGRPPSSRPSSDPFSMLALAVPLVAFYFLSIGIGKLLGALSARSGPRRRHGGRRRPSGAASSPACRSPRPVPARGPRRPRRRPLGAGLGPDRLGQDPRRRLRRAPGARPRAARPSTPRRSRRSPTRSSPSWRPSTAPSGWACSPATPPSGPRPRWW